MAGAGSGADGGDGGGRQAGGVGVAGGEPQAGAQRVTVHLAGRVSGGGGDG